MLALEQEQGYILCDEGEFVRVSDDLTMKKLLHEAKKVTQIKNLKEE